MNKLCFQFSPLLSEFRHKCEEDIDCEGELVCVLISNNTKTTGFNRSPAVSVAKLCQCPERVDEFDDNCNGMCVLIYIYYSLNDNYIQILRVIFARMISIYFNGLIACACRVDVVFVERFMKHLADCLFY